LVSYVVLQKKIVVKRGPRNP